MVNPLMSATEVAAHLGIERQTVYVYIWREEFPVADVETASGKLWKQSTIDRWQKGRPRAKGK
jgi:predicted DNA-binding transcriptional regulator AlpA